MVASDFIHCTGGMCSITNTIGGSWGTDYRGYRVVEVGDDNAIYTYQVNASQNPVLNTSRF